VYELAEEDKVEESIAVWWSSPSVDNCDPALVDICDPELEEKSEYAEL
jgi:hypothetical protein